MDAALARAWRLRWENGRKEAYWLLALDGALTGVRATYGHATASACVVCPGTLADRLHVFWACPSARAVRAAIEAQLRRRGHDAPLTREQLWLMQPPPTPAALHDDLWCVVCVAAAAAMERGRAVAFKLHCSNQPRCDLERQSVAAALGALRAAVADFAALGTCRPAARASVHPPRPPFFWAAHPHKQGALVVRG